MRKRIALLLLTLVLTAPGCAAVGEMLIDAAIHAAFDHDHDGRRERRRERRRQRLGPEVFPRGSGAVRGC